MEDISTNFSAELKQWKEGLESDHRNPVNTDELVWNLPSGIRIAPVYDAASLPESLHYLQEFHREWKQQKEGQKPVLKASSALATAFTQEETIAAEQLGFSSWAGVGPAGHQLPAENSISNDPITESLCLGEKTTGLRNLEKGILQAYPAINAVYFHRSGANEAEDLAYCLCLAAHYREVLGEDDYQAFLKNVSLHLAAGTSFFLEMARLRALRLLWMNFTSQCGAGRLAGTIQAESSLLFWSKSDTDGNLLRHTSAAMSAIMGGADALLIHPHTFEPASAADAIRLSADIGHLALEEARLKNTFDPGSGSYLIEMLTHELVQKAWELFCSWQEIPLEEKLRNGFFPEKAGLGATRLRELYAKEEITLTGVNRHPSPLATSGPACPVWETTGKDFPALKPITLDA